MPTVVFLLPGARRRPVSAPLGSSLLEAARLAGIPIEGACGGAMACATCHIHVDEAWEELLSAPTAEEEDMLDLAREPATTSRLGCQIRLEGRLDGLVVRVPPSSLLG